MALTVCWTPLLRSGRSTSWGPFFPLISEWFYRTVNVSIRREEGEDSGCSIFRAKK